jgi:undecaprenyl-diphosphatase
MIPVLFIGLFFRDEVESLFSGDLLLVGGALLVTSMLLISTQLVKSGQKSIPFLDALVMGIAQAAAVVPGISRSGATISAGLLLRNGRSDVARFSFLMVLLPIIGAALMDIVSISSGSEANAIAVSSLVIGFLAAYISGYLACSWMIRIVKRGNLYWFAIYCAIVGLLSIVFS